MRRLLSTATLAIFIGTAAAQDTNNYPTIGEVVRFDPGLDALIDPEAEIEVVSVGFKWSEGPVWVSHVEDADSGGTGGYILFSDIPPNRVMRWEENIGTRVFLEPAGYTGAADYGGEPGSNGLALDAKGRLVSCEHGDRRLSVMTWDGGKRTLADKWQGKRFNSPNDLAIHSSGAIYFTDPIYGLPKKQDDHRREIDFCGVYRLGTDGEVTLMTKEFERPNGIAFAPDEKTIYVAQSHSPEAVIKSFPVNADGSLGESSVLIDLTEHMGNKLPGAPDGLKVDAKGNLFATGPGGCWVITPEGKALGRISTGERMANCAWGETDGGTLYMTSDMYLCRIKTKTKGAGWK